LGNTGWLSPAIHDMPGKVIGGSDLGAWSELAGSCSKAGRLSGKVVFHAAQTLFRLL